MTLRLLAVAAQQSLDAGHFDNAAFLAQQALACISSQPLDSPSDATAGIPTSIYPNTDLELHHSLFTYLHAKSLFLKHPPNPHAAYAILTTQSSAISLKNIYQQYRTQYKLIHSASQYLLAQTCVALEKLSDAESVLSKLVSVLEEETEMADGNLRQYEDDDSFGFMRLGFICLSDIYALLGDVYRKSKRQNLAEQNYKHALSLNPFLWTCFEHLCQMGVEVDPIGMFNPDIASQYIQTLHKMNPSRTCIDSNSDYTRLPQTTSDYDIDRVDGGDIDLQSNDTALSSIPTELLPSSTTVTTANVRKKATTIKTSVNENARKTLSRSRAGLSKSNITLQQQQTVTRVKKRTKLAVTSILENKYPSLPQTTKSKNTTSSPPPTSTATISVPPDSNIQSIPSTATATATKTTSPAQPSSTFSPFMNHLQILGKAAVSFYTFKCRHAISVLESLSVSECESGWVLGILGRAYFEIAEYKKADDVFRKLRNLEPHQMKHMDIYSSTLWHLRQEVSLSYLAHELLDTDRRSPEAWCAIGNCFSLKKEHDVALKCFTRAIQIDPTFAYAHTLSGHEYISLEDLEKGLNCFRIAIRIDPRHYNAWYGLGYIFFRQEKYDFAEFHFKKALAIHPSNPILIVYMGMVFERKNKLQEALKAYESAERLRPDIHMYTFRRASTLYALGRLEDALAILEPLASADGGESNVFFLLGKVYAGLGEKDKAIGSMTVAQDLCGSKTAGMIRDEMDKLLEDEE